MEEQIRSYQKILKTNPTDVAAFNALEEIYKGKERWRELVQLYEERLRHQRNAEQTRLLMEKIAAIWHNKLGDQARAISSYEQVLRAYPQSYVALEGLEEISTRRGDWAKLADVLEQQVWLAQDATERANLYQRLGTLYRDNLKRRDKALVAWNYALATDPKRNSVMKAAAGMYREIGSYHKVVELLQREGDLGGSDPEALGQRYLQLSEELIEEPLYEQLCRECLDKAKKLLRDPTAVEALQAKLEAAKVDIEARIKRLRVEAVEAPDKTRAVSIYRRIAELFFLKGGHDREVQENLDKCALLQPGNPRLLAFTERYYLDSRRPKELITRLSEIANRVKDRKTVIVLLERIALLAVVCLQDRKLSIETYKRINQLEPGHSSAVVSLVEYYQEDGRWAEVVELLKGQVERQGDPLAKADLLFQLARITSDYLRDPQGARFLYEEIIRLDQQNLQAAMALERIYEKVQDADGLVNCLEIQLLHAHEKRDQLRLLDRLLDLQAERRKDIIEAYKVSLRALMVDPTRKKTFKEVIALGEETGRFQELASGLRAVLDSGQLEGKAVIDVLAHLASIYETRLNNSNEAIRTYQQILEKDAKNLAALDALERLHRAAGGGVELVAIYTQQLELVRSGQKKKELLYKLAEIYRERMADFASALSAYDQILQIDSKDMTAWKDLAELHEREAHWEQAATAYKRCLELSTDPVLQVQYRYRLAGIYEQRLNDAERALQLCNEILSLSGVPPAVASGTVTILERLQSRGLNPLRIAEILQPYYALAGDWRRHIDMLELRLEGCSGAEERVRLLERIAQVYEEKLEHKEQAFSTYGRAFSELPNKSTLREALFRLAQETSRLEELSVYLEEALKRSNEPPLVVVLCLSLGSLYRDRLNRPQLAIACFQRVLQHQSDNQEALEALSGLLRATHRWEELNDVLQMRLSISSDEAGKRDLLIDLGQVIEEELHDRPRAISIYQELHELEKSDVSVLRRLDALLEKEGRWPELADILTKEIALVPPQEASELNLRLGQVKAERMEERENAIEHYRQVLSERPEDVRAIKAIESLLERPDSAPHAAEILLPIYEQRSDWSPLARALEVRAEAQSHTEEKIRILMRVAVIYDRQLSQPDRAFAALLRAFRVDSTRADVFQQMERLSERLDNYGGLAAALEEALSSQTDPALQRQLLPNLAALYHEKLRRPDLAAASLRRLFEIDPRQTMVLGTLETIYREAKSFGDLAWVLLRQVESTGDPARRRELLMQVAQLSEEQLGDLNGAILCYQQIGEFDPDDLAAAKQMERLFELTNHWEEAAAVLPKLARLSKNTADMIEYNSRLAEIYATRLDQPLAAVETYKSIVEVKANHVETVASLEKLLGDERCRPAAAEVLEGVFRANAEWHKLAAILEMRLGAAIEPAQRLRFYAQLKELYEERCNEKERAFEVITRAFREQPHDEGIQRDLLRLAQEGEFFEELVAVYQGVIERLGGSDLAFELSKRNAEIHEKFLGKRASAVEIWSKLFAIREDDSEVLNALERLYREDGNFPALVQIYYRQLQLATEPEVKKDLLFSAAACLAEGVGDLDQAIKAYQQILHFDPNERRALRLLDQLLVARERYPELAEVLRSQIRLCADPHAPDPESAQELLLRLAHVQLDQLGDSAAAVEALQVVLEHNLVESRAIELLERMLTVEATRPLAAELLDPAYRQLRDFAKLVFIGEVRLAARSDPSERLKLYREMMRLYEIELVQKPKAFVVACRAFREHLEDEGIRRDLERLAQETGKYKELAEVYREVLPQAADTIVGPAIERRLAQLQETVLQDKDEAVSRWRQVLARDPDDLEALKALERLYRERTAYPELVGILRHLAELESDRTRRRDLYGETAVLMEERLGRNDAAIETYREILTDDPRDLEVLKTLERLLEKEHRHEELREILQAELEQAAEAELIPLKLRIANLLQAHLAKPEEAASLFADVLNHVPGQPDALAALVTMFDLGQAKSVIAPVLISHLEAAGDFRHLIAALDVVCEFASDLATRKSALTRMAGIFENRLGQKEQAFATLGRVLQLEPGDERVRLSIERLAQETNNYQSLISVYLRCLESLEERALMLTLRRRLAELCEEHLGDLDQAVEHLQAVVTLEPKDNDALVALERIYRQRGDFEALADVLRRRVRLAATPEERSSLLYEVGNIQEEKLHDVNAVILTYREVLEQQPDDLGALRALDRLCAQHGRLQELVEVLVAQIRLLDKRGERSESLDLRFRLGTLFEQEFNDQRKAALLYRDVLQNNPSHAATIQHLETALAEGRVIEGGGALLESAYERTGEWKKYVGLLEQQVGQSRVLTRRMEVLAKIAQVQEDKLGAKTVAFNTYVRMFHEDPNNPGVRIQLERIAAEDESFEALAAVYEQGLDSIEEPNVGVAIALKLAQIHEEQLADPEATMRYYQTALRFDGKNLTALKALERVFEQRQAYEDLVEVLTRLASAVPAGDQVPLLYRAGVVLLSQLKQSGKSIGYFRRALDLDPTHIESLRMLERAYTDQGEHQALSEALRSHLELATETTEKAELISRMAVLSADQLNRPDEAIELWKRLLMMDAQREDAGDALDQLYERTERWSELVQLIQTRMKRVVDPERIAVLSGRLAWVKGEKLGQYDDAIKNWQEVLRLDPKNMAALQAMRGIYTATGQWDNLLKVLNRMVNTQKDLTGVKSLRLEMADILGEKLSNRERAIEAAKRALDIEPHTDADLERLVRIFKLNSAWNEAVIILEQEAERKTVAADKIALLMDVASLWKDKIVRPLGAASAYEKILELDPFHEEAFRAAEEIYRGSKEWRRLATLLESRLQHIRERKDRVNQIKIVAEIYERNLGQKALAFARYCAAFREDFGDDAVLSRLEDLAAQTEDYETLLDELQNATEEVSSGPRAVRLFQKMAEIYLKHLNNPVAAEENLLRAVELDKRELSSLDSLAELYRQQERVEDLIHVLETKYTRSDELEERKDIRRHIARLHEQKLKRSDLAIESFRRILELDGRDEHTIQELMRLYQQEGRWEDLIQIMLRAADQTGDRGQALRLLFQIGSIWESQLNNEEQAIGAYRHVLEVEPTHLDSLKSLERIYTKLDRTTELLQVFDRQVQLVPDVEEKIKALNKLGSLWEERFDEPVQAVAAYDRILELDPNNLFAIKTLERLVRRLGDFNRLIDLYYRHVGLIDDHSEIVEIHLAIGEVLYHDLNRADRAEEVFLKALEIDPNSRQAMHALGQLYEKSGNWFTAIDMLKKEAELCGATPDAVQLFYRLGKINEDMLLDSSASREAYTRALAIDTSYLPAIKALKLIYYLEKDHERYRDMLIQEAEHTEDVEEKTRLLFEIGKFLQEQQDDLGRAAHYYEEALKQTPDYLPAAKPLADIYFRTEKWEQAEAMMEVVVAGLDRHTEAKELCRQYYRLGYITEKLNNEEKALTNYRLSNELDATYLPALEGLGNALLKAQRWDEAYRVYQALLIHHRDSLSDAEVAELYWQIGNVSYHMGEIDRAVGNFTKALEIDDQHQASLQSLARVYEEQEKWEEAYDYGVRLTEVLEGDELFEWHIHIAELCSDKIQDSFRAAEVLQGALLLAPDNLEVLSKLLKVYSDTQQHQKVVEVLERLIKVEPRPSRRVALHIQMAQILFEQLHDESSAVEHLNTTLDIDPSAVKAFGLIVNILFAHKDWLTLKNSYVRMIKRMPAEARKSKLALWKDLAGLCRALKSYNEAIDAYRMITSLDPNDMEALATLGDLLEGTKLDEAITIHHRVLAASVDRVGSYRSLAKLYRTKKEYDKVYTLSLILRHLKQADEEEQKIINFYSKKAPEVAARPISDQVWERLLAHPNVKVPITRVFATLFGYAMPMFMVDHKDLNLRRRGVALLDLARDRSLFCHNFRIGAKILGGPEIELYSLKDEEPKFPPGLMIALTKPTAVIAYRDVFNEDKQRHLLFYIGRVLAMMRREFILASAMPLPELCNLLDAVCLMVDPNHRGEGDSKGIERASANIKRHINNAGLTLLQKAANDYLRDEKKLSMHLWLEAVEHSVNRAGFVVCNDLGAALGILKNETRGLTPSRPIQKIRDVLQFAASQEYLSLREAIGLAVAKT